MDQSDIILLARAMGIDVPDEEVEMPVPFDGSPMDQAGDAEDEDFGMNDDNSNEQADLDTAFMVDQSLADAEANLTADSALSTTEGSSEDNSHDAIISAFCDITGSDPISAGHFLEVSCLN